MRRCAQCLGQQQGLVEAAFCQTQRMQGHGNQAIARANGLHHPWVLHHQIGKKRSPPRLRAELETIHALLPRPTVRDSGMAGINTRQRLTDAVGAQPWWFCLSYCIGGICMCAMCCWQQQRTSSATQPHVSVGAAAGVANTLFRPGMANDALAGQFPQRR